MAYWQLYHLWLEERKVGDGMMRWLKNYATLLDAWRAFDRGDWMRRLLEEIGYYNDRESRLLTCRIVRNTPLHDDRTLWDLLTDERSRKGIEAAEAYARREIAVKELRIAVSAVNNAVAAAKTAANADAASYAAYIAASAASCTTYITASYAADCAADAMKAAAEAAAYIAMKAAAIDAAAVYTSAINTARRHQAEIIRGMIPESFVLEFCQTMGWDDAETGTASSA